MEVLCYSAFKRQAQDRQSDSPLPNGAPAKKARKKKATPSSLRDIVQEEKERDQVAAQVAAEAAVAEETARMEAIVGAARAKAAAPPTTQAKGKRKAVETEDGSRESTRVGRGRPPRAAATAAAATVAAAAASSPPMSTPPQASRSPRASTSDDGQSPSYHSSHPRHSHPPARSHSPASFPRNSPSSQASAAAILNGFSTHGARSKSVSSPGGMATSYESFWAKISNGRAPASPRRASSSHQEMNGAHPLSPRSNKNPPARGLDPSSTTQLPASLGPRAGSIETGPGPVTVLALPPKKRALQSAVTFSSLPPPPPLPFPPYTDMEESTPQYAMTTAVPRDPLSGGGPQMNALTRMSGSMLFSQDDFPTPQDE